MKLIMSRIAPLILMIKLQCCTSFETDVDSSNTTDINRDLHTNTSYTTPIPADHYNRSCIRFPTESYMTLESATTDSATPSESITENDNVIPTDSVRSTPSESITESDNVSPTDLVRSTPSESTPRDLASLTPTENYRESYSILTDFVYSTTTQYVTETNVPLSGLVSNSPSQTIKESDSLSKESVKCPKETVTDPVSSSPTRNITGSDTTNSVNSTPGQTVIEGGNSLPTSPINSTPIKTVTESETVYTTDPITFTLKESTPKSITESGNRLSADSFNSNPVHVTTVSGNPISTYSTIISRQTESVMNSSNHFPIDYKTMETTTPNNSSFKMVSSSQTTLEINTTPKVQPKGDSNKKKSIKINLRIYNTCQLLAIFKEAGLDGYLGFKADDWVCITIHIYGYDIEISKRNSWKYGMLQISRKPRCNYWNMPNTNNLCKCFGRMGDNIAGHAQCIKKARRDPKEVQIWITWTKSCKGKYLNQFTRGCSINEKKKPSKKINIFKILKTRLYGA